MTPQDLREILAAEYARLKKIDDRAGAKKVWQKLHTVTLVCLRGAS